MRGMAAVLGLVGILLADSPRAAQDQDVSARLRAYIAAYEADIGAVVAEEELVQFIRGGTRVQRRHLVSDVGFLRLPGDLDWIGYRSVRVVDGRAVPVEAPSLADLLSRSGTDLRQRALAIAAENAQYNLGYPRTINLPTLPLDLLHPRRQASFAVTADGTERVGGTMLVRLEFLEHEPGSIVAASSLVSGQRRYLVTPRRIPNCLPLDCLQNRRSRQDRVLHHLTESGRSAWGATPGVGPDGGGNLMSCTTHVMGIPWEHHDWRRRVTGFEIREGEEMTIWGRTVNRDFVRCDTEEVCTVCGEVRRQASCTCDMERGERCPILVEWREAHGATGRLLT